MLISDLLEISNDRFLRNVILDDQLWTIRLQQGVAAKDLQGICTKIIVIILSEAQAELGYSTQVDEWLLRFVTGILSPFQEGP